MGDEALEVVAHLPEAFEVAITQGGGLGHGNAELGGKAVGGQAVSEAVGGRLNARPFLGAHLGDRCSEHHGGHRAVQVLAGVEGFDECLVPRQVRHEAHLDLRVVGAHERLESLTSDERAANAHTIGAARGNVLQVRIGRRKATRGRSNLGEGRVDASIGGDGRGQGVDHLLELDAVAVGEQEPEEVVPRSPLFCGLRVQVRQGLGVRRVPGLRLLRLGQAKVVEEELLELLGARQVDLAAGGSPRALARGVDGLAEFVG